VPNVAHFNAGMLKLQRMIKWDVFLGHGVDSSGVKTELLRPRLFRARPNSFDVASTLHADFIV